MRSSPDIFLEASRRLGREPGVCLVIEDAVSGVTAARAAARAAWESPPRFRPTGSSPPALKWTAPDLRRVPDQVLEW